MTSIVIYDTEVLASKKSFPNMWNDLAGVPFHVVQIGALKMKLDGDQLTVTDTFNALVKPRDLKGNVLPLTDHIKALSGLTQERMDSEGRELKDAAQDFAGFIGADNAFSWGRHFDTSALMMSLFHQGLVQEAGQFNPKKFGDLRQIFVKGGLPAERLPQNAEPGIVTPSDQIINSGRVAGFYGVEPAGHREHDAIKDVGSLLAGMRHLLGNKKISAQDFTL